VVVKLKHIIFFVFLAVSLVGHSQGLPRSCVGMTVRYGAQGWAGSTYEWFVVGGNIAVLYTDSADVVWYENTDHKIGIVEISSMGCVGDTVFLNVEVGSVKLDIVSLAEICAEDSFIFTPNLGFLSYKWSDNSTESTLAAKDPGIYWLEALDSIGCKSVDSAELVVNPLPVVDLGPDTMLCKDDMLSLFAGYDGALFTWSNGESGSMINVNAGQQIIWVRVEDTKGCLKSDTINIIECNVFGPLGLVPNTFTPNNDGDNDTWEIERILDYPKAEVQVFDRWGRMVYVKKGYSNDWDGRNKSGRDLPMDSYYYVINIDQDGIKPVVGHVTIVR